MRSTTPARDRRARARDAEGQAPLSRADGTGFVVALAALLAVWNNAANLAPRFDDWYVLVNLALAASLVLWARRRGLGWAEMGLSRADLPSGLRWGALALAAVALALGAAAAVPAARPLLDDARVAGMSASQISFLALVRVPLGTVVLEELAFRGVLFGAWERWRGRTAAVVGSSAVFGLWHLVPTAALLDANGLAADPLPRALALAGAVALTGGAGALLCGLRVASGSVAAPMLAHAAANSLGAAVAWAVP